MGLVLMMMSTVVPLGGWSIWQVVYFWRELQPTLFFMRIAWIRFVLFGLALDCFCHLASAPFLLHSSTKTRKGKKKKCFAAPRSLPCDLIIHLMFYAHMDNYQLLINLQEMKSTRTRLYFNAHVYCHMRVHVLYFN